MIISTSRRTDIPAYYSDWFFNRIQAGFVYVRNPMNFHQISKISLLPEDVDGIVFWTKDPRPMESRLSELDRKYVYYFQFTITSYGNDVEVNVPNKNTVIIPAFQQLSDQVGPERVIWRYDPIILTAKYTIDHHAQCFSEIAKQLKGYTKRCVISFVDLYRSIWTGMRDIGYIPLDNDSQYKLAEQLADIAYKNGMIIESCAEGVDLKQFGIEHGRCVDGSLFETLLGCKLKIDRDKNQRAECGCAASIDIGAYNTCLHGCKYCYANFNRKTVAQNYTGYCHESPLLCSEILPNDVIKERKVKSCKVWQEELFAR